MFKTLRQTKLWRQLFAEPILLWMPYGVRLRGYATVIAAQFVVFFVRGRVERGEHPLRHEAHADPHDQTAQQLHQPGTTQVAQCNDAGGHPEHQSPVVHAVSQ